MGIAGIVALPIAVLTLLHIFGVRPRVNTRFDRAVEAGDRFLAVCAHRLLIGGRNSGLLGPGRKVVAAFGRVLPASRASGTREDIMALGGLRYPVRVES